MAEGEEGAKMGEAEGKSILLSCRGSLHRKRWRELIGRKRIKEKRRLGGKQ